ncbi:hypothetical protein ROZALSC1DRAFT_25967, partial [Rozella allomycis CSF55]
KIGQIQECAPSSFDIPKFQTQEETLKAARLFDEKLKNLKEEVRQFDFLEKQLNEVSNNHTTLMNEYSSAQEKYFKEKELFKNQTEKITVVNVSQMSGSVSIRYEIENDVEKILTALSLPITVLGDMFSFKKPGTTVEKMLFPIKVREGRTKALVSMQSEFDKAPKHFADKFIKKAGFEKDTFIAPTFSNNNPNFNEYQEQIATIKKRTEEIKKRTEEIKKLSEEMKNSVFFVKDYEFKDSVFSHINNMQVTEDGKKSFIEKVSNFNVVYMNDTQK